LRGKIFRIGNMGWITRKDITLLTAALVSILVKRTTIKNIDKALQKIHEAPLLY
ncbi:MAG: aminotransferase, partial [Crenarchaeota archaeon]|nr:aminotransferase [Thermoproteota archaeon]